MLQAGGYSPATNGDSLSSPKLDRAAADVVAAMLTHVLALTCCFEGHNKPGNQKTQSY